MKKLFFIAACVLSLAACNQDKKPAISPEQIQNDSLRAIITARDNEINDMMGTLNEIQQGFAEINEAENRVTVAKDGEGRDKTAVIKENIQFIAQRMQENRDLIKKLQEQLRTTGFKGEQMQKAIESLNAQLVEKDKELRALRAELEKTDKQNLQTDKQNLQTEKQNLQNESNRKTETINTQDKQLNTAWFAFGTKKELKRQNVLVKGKVLQGSFNKNYFTKIDIRETRELKLYSKNAKILTSHPTSSYSLTKDASGQYVLRISDPATFWSTSKYLVVQVK